MTTVKNKQGWIIVDGVHCCYCQLAEYACPKHSDEVFNCTKCGADHYQADEWLCHYCRNGGE